MDVTKLLIINVYMPCCCPDNLDDYIMYLYKLNHIVGQTSTPNVFVQGDFNGDVTYINDRINHSFGRILADFCKGERYFISDVRILDDLS